MELNGSPIRSDGKHLLSAYATLFPDLITPPHQSSKQRWPKALRRWLASLRQIVETVNDKLLNTFRLAREPPHDLTGFQARLAAKVALHYFCIWSNLQRDEAPLVFAELLVW